MSDKTYIGDGVYARLRLDGDLVLTTENGITITNTIVLEPEVWNTLVEWRQSIIAARRIADPEDRDPEYDELTGGN